MSVVKRPKTPEELREERLLEKLDELTAYLKKATEQLAGISNTMGDVCEVLNYIYTNTR